MGDGSRARLIARVRHDYSSANVTTGAWTELLSTIGEQISSVEIHDGGGETMELGYGPSGSEKSWLYILPGGNGYIPAYLGAGGQRLSVRAVSANATTGELVINLWG